MLHHAVPISVACPRGDLLSSGFVIRRNKEDSSWTQISALYRLAKHSVSLVGIDDLVGDSQLMLKTANKLKAVLESNSGARL